MDKRISFEQAAQAVKDGSSVMTGGFFDAGNPQRVISAMMERNVRDITLITLDAGNTRCQSYQLIAKGHVSHMIVSHVGLNPFVSERVVDGSMTIELVPQGTLIERIRCGGAGLGGVLTPTGLGTDVQKGKQIIQVGGKSYLLETAMRADVAILRAHRADRFGNLYFRGNTRNFNMAMATAADYVIAEVRQYTDEPIEPEQVHIPGLFVDAVCVLDEEVPTRE